MAGRIEVAQGYITIVPSLKGVRQKIASELEPAAAAAGRSAGAKLEDGISDGAKRGADSGAKAVEASISKAASETGKSAGSKLADGLKSAADKAGEQASASLGGKLADAFKRAGSGISGSLSWVKGAYADAFADMGRTISSSRVGQAFQSVATGAKAAFANAGSALSSAMDAAKGKVSAVTSAVRGIASDLGTHLKAAGSLVSEAFSGVRSVVSSVVSHVASAFGGIASALSGPLSAIGGAISSAFGAVAPAVGKAMAAATAGATALGGMALNAFGNFQQLEGGIRLALGDEVWATVEERSQNAFRDMQISQNNYLTKVNAMATGLRESLGGDQQAAADLADRVITAEADIVSAMGVTQEAVDNAFNGIMKGNFTMLDNLALGIKPTKEGMQEVIDIVNRHNAEMGRATDYTIDNLADCQAALADYVDYLGLSGYAASEGADTVRGAISKMRGAWTDWMAELGKTDSEGNYVGDMSRVTANLSESVQDVVRNVAPVLANAVGTVARELPSLVAEVGPQLSSALVSIVDEATGGIASRALRFLSPVTDALKGVLRGLGSWLSDNSGTISEVGDKLGEVGFKVMDGLGSAIEWAAPVVAGFADGALAALSAGLDLASGLLDVASGFASAFVDAVRPLVDAVAPVAEAVGGWLCGALSDLGGWLSGLDFSGFAQGVSGALQGVVDLVGGCLDKVKGFFDEVGRFLADPVGYVQDALLGMATSTEQVSSAFSGTASDVSAATYSMQRDVQAANSTRLDDKSATYQATGNVPTGAAQTAVASTQSAVRGLDSKRVTVDVAGNVATTSIAWTISSLSDSIRNLQSKTVTVHTNYTSSSSGVTAAAKAEGGLIPRYASGAIFTGPTLTDVGWIGEAGAEAVYTNKYGTGIVPLTNHRYTGPFASEISEQVLDGLGSGGDTITVNLNYSAGTDANQMARDLARAIERQQSARGRR